MPLKVFTLIFLSIFIIDLCVQGSKNECFTVYVCCKRTESDCLEYCPPTQECHNQADRKIEEKINAKEEITTTEYPTELTTIDHNFTAVLNTKLCRKGWKFINTKCRQVV